MSHLIEVNTMHQIEVVKQYIGGLIEVYVRVGEQKRR